MSNFKNIYKLKHEWNLISKQLQSYFDKLSMQEVDSINGSYTALREILEQKYNYSCERAEAEIYKFLNKHIHSEDVF